MEVEINLENIIYIKREIHDLEDIPVENQDSYAAQTSVSQENNLQTPRRLSVDSINLENYSETNEHSDKFTGGVFVGYSSDTDGKGEDAASDSMLLKQTTRIKKKYEHEKRKRKNKKPKNKKDEIYSSVGDSCVTIKIPTEKAVENILECCLCHKQFPHMSVLKMHILKHDSYKVLCLICDSTISDPEKLSAHVNSHLKEKKFVCQSCGKAFRRSANVLRHELDCRKEKKSLEELCTMCGKICSSKWQMQQHMMFHSDERPFPCAYCSKSFRFKARLQEHERTHLGIKPYSCDICRKSFTTSSDLKKHQKRHKKPGFKAYNTENNPNKLSVCRLCNKKVVNLKKHMFAHYEKGSGTCNICGKILKTKSLYQHIKIHLERAVYKCEICNRNFNRKDNMETHRERHTKAGYKPKAVNSSNDNADNSFT